MTADRSRTIVTAVRECMFRNEVRSSGFRGSMARKLKSDRVLFLTTILLVG